MRREIFLLIGVLFLVVIGFLGPERTMDALTKARGVLLSGITVSLPIAILEEEGLEITLPETTEPVDEEVSWEIIETSPEQDEEVVIETSISVEEEGEGEGEELVVIAPKEETKMSLAEIQEQVDDISEKAEVISEKVARLVEEQGGLVQAEPEPETDRLADIRAKIDEISAQIESLSAEVTALSIVSEAGA